MLFRSLSLKPGKITLYIGRIINPLFLVFYAVLLISALMNPSASISSIAPSPSYETGSLFSGLVEGYGTMDAIAGLAFGIVVVDVIRKMGVEKKEDIVFVTNPKLAITQKQDLMVEDLLYNPFFLTEKNENYRKELDQFLESKDIILTPSLESSNTEFIIRMIIENGGISYLPYFAVEKSIKSGELAVLKVKDFQLSMYQQIFYHKSKWKTKEMEEFIRLAQMNRS